MYNLAWLIACIFVVKIWFIGCKEKSPAKIRQKTAANIYALIKKSYIGKKQNFWHKTKYIFFHLLLSSFLSRVVLKRLVCFGMFQPLYR